MQGKLRGAVPARSAMNPEQMLEDFAAAWSQRDVDKILSYYTDDCVYEDVALGRVMRGREEIRTFIEELFRAVPDFRIEHREALVSGEGGAAEWVISGTHTSDLPGLPATGRRFSIRGASVLELQDGKIRRISDYWDTAAFLRQLGLLPEEMGES